MPGAATKGGALAGTVSADLPAPIPGGNISGLIRGGSTTTWLALFGGARRRGVAPPGCAQLPVELQLARRIDQAQFGQQQLVEKLLPALPLAAGAHAPHPSQGRIGCRPDALRIVFEIVQGEQLIIVERTIGCPQAKPLDVRIKRLGHGGLRFGDWPRQEYERSNIQSN